MTRISSTAYQRRIGLAIALREGVAIALEARTRLRARMDRRERLHEAVDPGANNFADRLFQDFPVRIGRRAVAPADDEVHAHQRAFGKERIERADMTLVDVGQIVADRLAGVAAVKIPRHEDEHRHEAIEAVAPWQHAHARSLVELQDRQAEAIERVLVDLKQLVTRIGLQHIDQGLAGMSVGIEARAPHHGVDLAAQIRDGAGRARIGGRGEQADDADLAGEAAVAVEPLDPDIVHVDTPVYARAHSGFGDEQKPRLVEELANLRRHGHQLMAAPHHPHLALAQQAEAGLELRLERVFGGVEQVVPDGPGT